MKIDPFGLLIVNWKVRIGCFQINLEINHLSSQKEKFVADQRGNCFNAK